MPMRTVQRWCEPKSILLVSEMTGEPHGLLGVVRQAKANRAEVLFLRPLPKPEVDDVEPASRMPACLHSDAHDELGRALRWAELFTECVLLNSQPPDKLPALVASMSVGRVVIGNCEKLFRWDLRGVPGIRLLNALQVPALVFGSRLSRVHAEGARLRNILVPISFSHDPRPQLRLGCFLARKHNARLKVLHVFGHPDSISSHELRTPVAVGAQLPLVELAHEGFLYPFQVSVASGAVERVILDVAAKEGSDLIVLGGPSEAESAWKHQNSVFATLLAEIPIPLMVAGRALGIDAAIRMRPFALRATAVSPHSASHTRESDDALC